MVSALIVVMKMNSMMKMILFANLDVPLEKKLTDKYVEKNVMIQVLI